MLEVKPRSFQIKAQMMGIEGRAMKIEAQLCLLDSSCFRTLSRR